MNAPIQLRGVVSRIRHNEPESGRPFVELEYVKRCTQLEVIADGPSTGPGNRCWREWTTARDEAEVMDWDAAEALAKSVGGNAAIVSRDWEWEHAALPEGSRGDAEGAEGEMSAHGAAKPGFEDGGVPPAVPTRQERWGKLGTRKLPAWRPRHVTPEECYERLERQHLD